MSCQTGKKIFIFRGNAKTEHIHKEGIFLKRSLKPVTCALVAALSLSVVPGVKLGPLGVDVVSAATGAATPAAPAPKAPAAPKVTAPKTTAAPKAAVTTVATAVARLLAVGSNGSDVALLQTKLNENGFKLSVDGVFGERTLEAVKSYQGKNGLKADGIVGPKTLAKLNPAPVVTPEPTPAPAPTPVDVVTTASLVNNVEAFAKGISKDGKWIISTLNDLTSDKTLVLEGEFKNGKKNADGTDAIQRKIALYTQDKDKNVTARFTLTAPKLVIKSPNARIQSGTFKGDLYVRVPNFQLVDATVDGNVYFTTKEAQDTFKMDAKSSVTGKQLLTAIDTTTSASLVDNVEAFEKGISKDGKWIISVLNDLTTNKTLVLDGEFKNGKKDAAGNELIQRKISLYNQISLDGKKVPVESYTLTAPKLVIKSPEARIQGGTFKGDLYVRVPNFQLVNAKVDGNVYFTTQEAQDTFKVDANSSVTGKQLLTAIDTTTSASLVDNVEAFEKGISKDGKWIISVLNDLTTDKALVLDGEFKNGKKDAAGNELIQRKISLYNQISLDGKKVPVESYTLTAPTLTINSPEARIQGGTFKGDVYVTVPNFQLVNAKVDGNVYFTTKEAQDTFKVDANSSVTGKQELKTN
ncbi:peptidoglycan-binding domain-containing protein [Anaerosolibacter sp.]|uniref:peptidoglycan-binding domain-containing protein n=1 Tax=Anaerosolibacter sp. TaxID=1872527 RepID=UPI0039EF2E8B